MARSNYQFEKRKRDFAKQQKQEAKRQRKAERKRQREAAALAPPTEEQTHETA